jgi:hypothetical protein
MYLRIVIILNGVSDKSGHQLNLTQSLLAVNKKAFTFQPELRSGSYTPML